MQVRLYAGLSLKSGSRFVFCRFYTGRITKRRESYVTFAKQNGSVTVTYLKVRTNLYTSDELATITSVICSTRYNFV